MARIVKEYTVRRNEILDVARRLVYTKGYEQMAIQDILDELQIAKGTFYHYFDSKQALLEAIIERMIDEAEQLLLPIVHDPHLPVLEKLQCFFLTMGRWKTTQKPFLIALLRVWFTDDNAYVRQKVNTASIRRIIPLLTAIILQGIQEDVLNISYPDQIGAVLWSLIQGAQETLVALLLSGEPAQETLQRVERTVAAYTDVFERVLGAPHGSFSLSDAEALREWVFSSKDNA